MIYLTSWHSCRLAAVGVCLKLWSVEFEFTVTWRCTWITVWKLHAFEMYVIFYISCTGLRHLQLIRKKTLTINVILWTCIWTFCLIQSVYFVSALQPRSHCVFMSLTANPQNAEHLYIHHWDQRISLKFEILLHILVSSFWFIWILLYYSYSAGIDIRHQNLTSTDVRFWRLNSTPAL